MSWQEIPARFYSELTEDEKREIELEENVRRKDLTTYERSKKIVELFEVAAEVLRESGEFLVVSAKNSPGGRPLKADAEVEISGRIGIPQKTINDARHHVAAVQQYPELASPLFPQKDVIAIAKNLDAHAHARRVTFLTEALRT